MRRIYQRYSRGLKSRVTSSVKSTSNKLALLTRQVIVSLFVLPVIYSPRLNRCQTKPSTREKFCFLILRHRYDGRGAKFGESIEGHNVSGPLRAAGIADVVEFNCDTDRSWGILADSHLVSLVTQVQPDLIILGGYNPSNQTYPQFEVLRAIRSKSRIPIVAMWADSNSEAHIRLASHLSEVVDLNIEWGSGRLCKHFKGANNFLRLWAPLDFSLFHPGNGCRDISLSFVGSTAGYHNNVRQEHLDYLNDHDIDVYRSGGVREQLISIDQYAEILRRSRISLNFSHSAPGTHQVKARVFEVLFSGAMLLENENDETSQFFTPNVDYVSFDSKADLLDKVRYYLEHEDEREQIANNGFLKATKDYNHEVFWSKVMERLGELKLL